ncbi:cbb3-type cytochrome c oxidase subunit I [Haloarchaeobius salinus]|uniref:cbb3-type cytochrome c oxidase subunit I n=1 Tax=Haloarchaeobius salinus TaxID=1198298 RepID=UPI0021099B49|nr:cbb3-type cytochrome c oxidase subunit I [Haloarchaeobius salinus]
MTDDDHGTTTDGTGDEPVNDGGTASDGGLVDDDRFPTGGVPDTSHEDDDEHGLPPTYSIRRWFVTTNHKDIGLLYTVTALFFLIFGGLLALLMRLELWAPGANVMSAGSYNQAVSAHGLIMVFWFLSPLAFGFANYIVPLQIGAKDLAFPRLNALSYWLYLFSGILMGISFFQGSTFNGGWTMYAPLNMPVYTPEIGGTTTVLALILFVASATVGSVNFLTTMHRMRAEGMTLRRMPIFTWSILLTVWMMLFAFAALLAALMLLSSDRLIGTGYFAESSPGGAMLWAHLFWFFGHPEVYIVFFPALGAMAEIFQTFTGRRLVGRKWFIGAMLLVAIQSFVVWMHHMFLTSINLEIKTLFMATTIGISLPFDLMVFSLIYTMLKGKIRFKTPFLFGFGALVLFILGGITGVFLGAVVLDYTLRGTYWVVAHFHYVMVGGVTGLVGGLYYWFPKMTGRMYDETLGKVHFGMYFVGFNLLYFPMFIAWETPRRVFEYAPALTGMHQLSTVGAFLLGSSFLVMFYNLFKSAFVGEEVEGQPWDFASTAEWTVPSPPPLENFPGVPTYASGRLEFEDGGSAQTDGGAVHGKAAALPGSEATETDHEGGESHASIWPFVLGLGGFLVLLGLSGLQRGYFPDGTMGGLYIGTAVVGGIVAFGSLVAMTREKFHGPEGPFGESWPFTSVENTKLGLWIFLASDVILFGAFIGAYVFSRVAYGWTDWHHLIPEAHVVLPGLINTYLLLTSSFAVVIAMEFAERENRLGVVGSLLATVGLGVGFLINKGIEWQHLFHISTDAFPAGWDPATNIASTTFYVTTGLHALHVIVGLVIAGYMIFRAWGGAYMGDDEPIEYFGLYWHFVDIVWLFLFPLFYIV